MKQTMRFAWLALSLLLMYPCLALADTLDDARAGIAKRFEQLRDVRIEYDLHEVFRAPPGPRTRTGKISSETRREPDGSFVTRTYPPGEERISRGTFLDGEITKHCIWRRCNDCIRLDTSDDGTAPQELQTMHAIQSAYGNRVDMRTHQVSVERQDGKDVWKREPIWCITPREGDPIAQIDIALGLRMDDSDRLMKLEDLQGLEIVSCDEQSLKLSLLKRNGLHLLHFSAKYGWALDRYQMFQQGQLAQEWRCEDFRQANGVWMPHRVTMQFKSPLAPADWLGRSLDITVRKFDLAPQDGGEASFPLVFPNGSIVQDARHGMGFKIETGDQTISDEKIAVHMEAYGNFEKEAQERMSRGWKPTEQELNEMLAKHLKAVTR